MNFVKQIVQNFLEKNLSFYKKLFKTAEIASKDILEVQRRCFKVAGFANRKKLSKFTQWLSIFVVAFCCISEGTFIVENRRDVLAAAEAFGPFATAILGLVKIATFHVSLDKFNQLMERIKNLNKTGLFVRGT